MATKRSVDWERIYAMEREVWGETFEHAGAPSPDPLWDFFGELVPRREFNRRRAALCAGSYNPFENPSLPLREVRFVW